jgi:hypothetical protein
MANKTRLYTLLALAGAAACGGVSTNDFSAPVGSGGSSAAGHGGSGAQGGSTTTGGSGGTDAGGTGGSNAGAGADGGTGGSTGGTGADGGTGGSTGGTGAAGGSGGASGSGATGGTSAGTGGTAMGGAGGATGGSAGKPNGGAGSGGMGTDCAALMKTYQDTLTAARVCNPKSGKAQCTLAVPEAAVCGCEVYANPDNTDAVAMLMSLREQATRDCLVACPAIACIQPMPSNCRANPTGDSGQCTPGGITP